MTANHLKFPGGRLGNPVLGARAIITEVLVGKGPLRQPFASDAHPYAVAKVRAPHD